MTPEEETRAAEMFAAGASEREVAAELDISPSSANRLKKRLAAKGSDGDSGGLELAPVRRPYGSDVVLDHPELAEIEAAGEEIDDGAERDVVAGVIETYEARAQASRQALAQLEAERLQLLDSDQDAAPLRPRIASVREDLADSETAAQLARNRMAVLDARIAERAARKEMARLRAELDAAVAERDEVYARSGDRQRAAVAAVRAAAEDFCAVFADERTVTDRVAVLSSAVSQRALRLGDQVPVPLPAASTRLVAQGGTGPELALTRAMFQADRGDVAAVARQLGEVNGWLPPGPPTEEELAERRRIFEERERQLAEPKSAPGPGGTSQAHTADLDHNGRELWLRPPHPMDVYGQGYANTTGSGYGSGYRTGY